MTIKRVVRGSPRSNASAGPTGAHNDVARASWTKKHSSTNQGHDVIENTELVTNHTDPLQQALDRDWPR